MASQQTGDCLTLVLLTTACMVRLRGLPAASLACVLTCTVISLLRMERSVERFLSRANAVLASNMQMEKTLKSA